MDEQIIWLGYQKKVALFIENCILLVHPAENEPLGRVVIEALYHGKLVVAADSGGIPEYIQHGVNGFLFKSGNYESLAQQIITAMEWPDKSSIAENAIKTAYHYFDCEMQSRKIIKIYTNLLSNSN